MSAPIQTIQKSYFTYLENFIKEHLDMLCESRIFIFGAGIRGGNLLWILKYYHLSDVYFVDNNVQKQGSLFENCAVLSFSEAERYAGKHIFLCPVENGGAILEQLRASGRKEGSDYFNLDFPFNDYRELVEDLKRPASEYALLFGCCVLSSYILDKAILPPLGEFLNEQIGKGICKVCTLPGFYPAIYYHAVNVCLRVQNGPPRCIVMMMEISSLSPYAPLMMGPQNYRQHERFVDQLAALAPEDGEIRQYLQKVRDRLERSLRGSSPTKAENTLEACRRVYKLKYMYHLREDDESVVYTRKILSRMKEKGVPVILLFPPVDYQRGESICGKEFTEKYAGVVKQLISFLDGHSYRWIDASFIASSDFFVPPSSSPDINPFLNAEGQKLLAAFLERQNIM